MSIDPASIPNFGGQQPDPQATGPAGPVVPDQDLVKQLLEQMELKYVVDDEGDLAAPWEDFRTYFMFRGEDEQQVFSVRTFYDRPHKIDEKPQLLESIDDWNRRTLWPKVYSHTHDDGSVRLIGEAQMLIGTGVNLEHFVSSTVSWVRASIEFDKWLVEQFGLEKEVDSAADQKDGEEGGDSGTN
ncbi:YbjN domain-containing protein [Streptomyces sp. NPDC099050]|uniref:YbjN domain-containing protein n=1 Tax=Streptomyces sp. NPDC099050 TaxID=3366100 RepID=UPI003823DAD9